MQSFLNSPPGPLGAAGQASNSTQPPRIFSNAPQPFSGKLGQGVKNFADKFKQERMLKDATPEMMQMFQGLFGGEGNMLSALEQGEQGGGYNPFQPSAAFMGANILGPGGGQTLANNPALAGQTPGQEQGGRGATPFTMAAGAGNGVGPSFNPTQPQGMPGRPEGMTGGPLGQVPGMPPMPGMPMPPRPGGPTGGPVGSMPAPSAGMPTPGVLSQFMTR